MRRPPLHDLRPRLLRRLAGRLDALAAALRRSAGEPAVRPAAALPVPPDGPPGGPPGHWLERVRRGAPHLLDASGRLAVPAVRAPLRPGPAGSGKSTGTRRRPAGAAGHHAGGA